MCFLALIYRTVRDYPVVVGANRDEYRDRPGEPPRELPGGIWAGVDPKAGGTWLGVNRRGLVVGIANLGLPSRPAAGARSRGLLCLDMLALSGSADLPEALRSALARNSYSPFNLLVADAGAAWAAAFDGTRLDLRALSPGVHVVGNGLPDDPDDPRVARGRMLIGRPTEISPALGALRSACRDHGSGGDRDDAICLHLPDRATLSSTLIALHATRANLNVYRFADGNPCQLEYRDLSRQVWPVGPS